MIRNIILNFISFGVWYIFLGAYMPMIFKCSLIANMVGTFSAFLLWNLGDCVRNMRFARLAWGYLPQKQIKEIVHYQNTGERL
jgi:hypothetical protein